LIKRKRKKERALRDPPRVGYERKMGTSLHPLTGLVTSSGELRGYASATCGRVYTLAELTEVYVAQSAVWNMFGYGTIERPWQSALTSMPSQHSATKEQVETFYNTGEAHVEHVVESLQRFFEGRAAALPLSRRTVLDFGCGIGQFAFAFAERFGRVLCVDQSVHHLRRAQEETAAIDSNRSAKIDWVTTTPDLLAALHGRRAHVVHSMIALQHTPHLLQVAYLEQLCDALHPGGIGWLHVTTSDVERARFRPCDLDSVIAHSSFTADKGVHTHTTPADEVAAILARRGCEASLRAPQIRDAAQHERLANAKVRSMVVMVSKPPGSSDGGGDGMRNASDGGIAGGTHPAVTEAATPPRHREEIDSLSRRVEQLEHQLEQERAAKPSASADYDHAASSAGAAASCGAAALDYPSTRLPWTAADRAAALQALARLRRSVVTPTGHGKHLGSIPRSLCRGAGDYGVLLENSTREKRAAHRASCLQLDGFRHRIDNRSTTREKNLSVPVNGKILSVDDIVYGYEQLFQLRSMHSEITFHGVAMQQDPSDALAIADLLWRVRPRLLIELGTSGGGSAAFFARTMRGYDPEARVLTIDPAHSTTPLIDWNHFEIRAFCPWCRRANETQIWASAVTFLNAFPQSDAAMGVARRMHGAAVAAGLPVMVMEDSDHVYEHCMTNIRAYAPLVTAGSYLIVQDTRAGRKYGPTTAVADFLREQARAAACIGDREHCSGGAPAAPPRFVRDYRPEHFLISQHSGGFLRRLEDGERPCEYCELN
jgi:cephalosporin hydroxylase/2-polyprenyl-3-methyl-5-hydroxy-6-metoxy-1,4-benzoquinol methylase